MGNWTDAEIEKLKEFYAAKVEIRQIAAAMNRSEKGVGNRLRRLGLTDLFGMRSKAWNAEDIDVAWNLSRTTTLPISEIARRLGRTESAVRTKLKQRLYELKVAEQSKCPDAILRDRETRIEALGSRSITGALMGDPPPGFSALDRRQSP